MRTLHAVTATQRCVQDFPRNKNTTLLRILLTVPATRGYFGCTQLTFCVLLCDEITLGTHLRHKDTPKWAGPTLTHLPQCLKDAGSRNSMNSDQIGPLCNSKYSCFHLVLHRATDVCKLPKWKGQRSKVTQCITPPCMTQWYCSFTTSAIYSRDYSIRLE